MFRALLRYLFFTCPGVFLRGLEFIVFDKEEITQTYFDTEDQKNKQDEENRILINYLEQCRKQIYKRGK